MKSKTRVLLLESDRLMADNVTKMLKRRGHSVDWQVEPQAATNSADNALPDVIILDLILAGRSGIEFLYELRSYPDWQSIPVIIFSDISPQEVGLGATGFDQLNIAAFHYKPATTLAQLAQTVEVILQPIAQQ